MLPNFAKKNRKKGVNCENRKELPKEKKKRVVSTNQGIFLHRIEGIQQKRLHQNGKIGKSCFCQRNFCHSASHIPFNLIYSSKSTFSEEW